MCAAGVRRSIQYRPTLSYRDLNRRLSGWRGRAANDNRPHGPPRTFALLRMGKALIGALAGLAPLSRV